MQWVYLIGHHGPQIPSTHINFSTEPLQALDAHNQGKERDTRKAAGQWLMLLMICVPSTRHIDVARLTQYWRSQKRTVQHRFTFGVQMAAKMLLVCFASSAALKDTKTTDRDARRLIDKALARIDSEPPQTLKGRVDRYLQNPISVYTRRNQMHPTLDAINTISEPTNECFTKKPEPVQPESADDDEELVSRKVIATTTRRIKTSMAVVYSIVNLQQSTAFNDLSTATDARAITTESAGSRKRQSSSSNSLVLQQYGESLCVDMHSSATLANMKVIAGQEDHHCVCGASRDVSEKSTVILEPSGKARRAQRCGVCGRNSRVYERYCIDTPSAARSMHSKPVAEPDDESTDSVDLFVKTLLVSFNDDNPPHTQKRASKRVEQLSPKRSRRRLFTEEADEHDQEIESLLVDPPSSPPAQRLIYGSHSVACSHASLTKLSVSRSDSEVIASMLSL